jgi:uncharacterized protein
VFFVDTSAIAKRYIPEIGSLWVRNWIKPQVGNDIIISALTTVEFVSVARRREREGFISAQDRVAFQNDFLLHVESEYIVIALDDRTLTLARDLLAKYQLRALDSLQLASAIRSARAFQTLPTFVSADTHLLQAAAAEGLPTDDPNTHP